MAKNFIARWRDALAERIIREAKTRVEHEKIGRFGISAADISGSLEVLIAVATDMSETRDEAIRNLQTRISQASALQVLDAKVDVVQVFTKVLASGRITSEDFRMLADRGIALPPQAWR